MTPRTLLGGHAARRHEAKGIHVSTSIINASAMAASEPFVWLKTRQEGLHTDEARARLTEYMHNILTNSTRIGLLKRLFAALLNPLVILLAVLALVSFVTRDVKAGTMMVLMIALSVSLKLIQEVRAGTAAGKLKARIRVTATVIRDGASKELPIAELGPGDIVQLAAGDMIPADVRIVQAKELFVNQSALTGESSSVEKYAVQKSNTATSPAEFTRVAFLVTSVETGSALATVISTGKDTYLGGMAASLSEEHTQTAFDRGVSKFTWLMLRLMFVLVPLVFVINGLTKHDWTQAFFLQLRSLLGSPPRCCR